MKRTEVCVRKLRVVLVREAGATPKHKTYHFEALAHRAADWASHTSQVIETRFVRSQIVVWILCFGQQLFPPT